MPDPLELLDSFPRSLTGAPPVPDELRKRGDHRRTRNRIAGSVAVAAVLAALVTPLAMTRDTDSSRVVPTVPPAPSLAGDIPGTFPLNNGLDVLESALENRGDEGVAGSYEGDRIDLTACGKEATGQPTPVDSLRGGGRDGSTSYERQVMTFADHASARQWVDAVSDMYRACPTETLSNDAERTHDVTVFSGPSGSYVSIASHDTSGSPGQRIQVDQLYVVGRAVLLDQLLDVQTSDSPDSLAAAQAQRATDLVSALGRTWAGSRSYLGTFVTSSSDAATKLAGFPADFVEFAGTTADQLQASADCPDAAVGVTVDYVVDDTWAVGAVNQCGGYVALWGNKDGQWKELLGTQDEWTCPDLKRLGVPQGIVSACYVPGEQ